MGDALAHSVLPGMALAFLLGISPFLAAVPAGIAIALLMGYLTRRTGISDDTSIGVVFAGMFALGLVMLSTDAVVNVNIEDLLLGQVLGVSQTDVYVSLGLTALVVAGVYTFHRQFVYTTFDPVGATVIGDQDWPDRIRASCPRRPGHRHRHPGLRNCPGHGDAHHARSDRVHDREAFRWGYAHRGGDRRNIGGSRSLSVVPCQPALRAVHGAGSHRDLRDSSHHEKDMGG